MNDASRTEYELLDELDRGVLKWGAAVGACWPAMAARGWVERNFGGITRDGQRAAAAWREEAMRK